MNFRRPRKHRNVRHRAARRCSTCDNSHSLTERQISVVDLADSSARVVPVLRISPNPLAHVPPLAALLTPLPSPADCPGASGTCTTASYNLACLIRKARLARIPQQRVHRTQMVRHQPLPELLRLTNTSFSQPIHHSDVMICHAATVAKFYLLPVPKATFNNAIFLSLNSYTVNVMNSSMSCICISAYINLFAIVPSVK